MVPLQTGLDDRKRHLGSVSGPEGVEVPEPGEHDEVRLALPERLIKEPRGSVLLIADFTGAEFDRIAIDRVKESTVFDRPHLKRSAWVGIEKLPKVFYEHIKNFSQRDLPAFETREQAMDWLVSNEELRSSDATQDRTLGDLPKRRGVGDAT